jgi:hypothetical protein
MIELTNECTHETCDNSNFTDNKTEGKKDAMDV